MDEDQPSWLTESAPAPPPPGKAKSSKGRTAPPPPPPPPPQQASAAPAANSWADSVESGPQDPANATAVASSVPQPPYKTAVKYTFLIVNLGLMIFMAATGALGVKESNSINDAGVVFVGIYMIVFAGILTVFEISQVAPCEALDNIIKKNFGFLYGTLGKCAYTMFMGILAFGLSIPRKMALSVGVLVCAWAVLQVLIFMKFPQYFDQKTKYVPT